MKTRHGENKTLMGIKRFKFANEDGDGETKIEMGETKIEMGKERTIEMGKERTIEMGKLS